jgi:hypothetical protein
MVERLLLDRDQLSLAHDFDHGDVRGLVEELGGRKIEHTIVLHDDQETLVGPADAVRDLEVERRREHLHFVGDAVAVAIGHRPDSGLARADEEHVGRGRHRHVPGVRHDGEEIDLEAGGQPDALEVLADRVGIRAGLRHGGNVQIRSRDLELLQLFEILGLCCSLPRERKGEHPRRGPDGKGR